MRRSAPNFRMGGDEPAGGARQTDDPAAVKALKPLCLVFQTDEDGRATCLALDSTLPVKDDDLRHLTGLAALSELTLSEDITDAGLRMWGKCGP